MGSFFFKKFTVRQIYSAMKVNTDSVLIGAWANLQNFNKSKLYRVIDIGTGTGIIALMIAQRLSEYGEFFINAVEIDKASADEAENNFIDSPWSKFLQIHKNSFVDFVKSNNEKFDLIITNPPYFINSLKSDSLRKRVARHSDFTLSQADIAFYSSEIISQGGKLVIILPFEESEKFENTALGFGLFLNKRCYIKTTATKSPKRVLAEYSKLNVGPVIEEELVIQDEFSGDFTEAYKNLTKEYYLRF